MRLFNDGWEFCKQPLYTELKDVKEKTDCFYPVGIPHDWMIYQPDALYEDGMGWYRKSFSFEKREEQRIFLRFDGIYMDSRIYVNGEAVGEWKYGYTTFEIDITDALKNGENEVYVSVTYEAPNSRWYTGAGIYRNVWLKSVWKQHLVSDGIYFSAVQESENRWDVRIDTEVEADDETLELEYLLIKKETGESLRLTGEERIAEGGTQCRMHQFQTVIDNPAIWDIEDPQCYELKVTLKRGEEILQTESQTVGFRSFSFSAEEGCKINGRKVKLNGVCEHHDLGCLGAAFHTKAMRRKFETLKRMGVNSVRTAHNMPAPEVMELADEMGILIVTESFDTWESPKNEYDYSRFFKEWYSRDIANWVRRDRNHPSLLMWSIGNEISDTHTSESGQEWCRKQMEEVRRHDPRNNAEITIASNYMPWENAQKCADIVKIAGYNYGEKYYNDHHEKHPDWVIYGSETGSVVQSRGIYHFPYQQSVLTDEDEQCSDLGNSTTSWGAASAESCLLAEIQHPFSCGQFVWSGFDFIGEPTPYHTRSSYFGQIDTAGFPKDSFYIYQAGWTDYRTNPMVHIFPYWDFNEGQLIDVRVCSNAPTIELFFNGKSQGICELNLDTENVFAGHWQMPYETGELRAVACDENGTVIAEEVRHSFGDAAKLCLKASENELAADGEELLFVEVSMEDKDGYPVENANNRVQIEVEGAGALVGTDNGDSTDTDGYKDSSRRLFSGKLLVVLKAGCVPGELKLRVRSYGMEDAGIVIPVRAAEVKEGISENAYLAVPADCREQKQSADIRFDKVQVRNILLTSSTGMHLHPENTETILKAQLCPENADDREVIWSIVDDAGIPLKIAEIEPDGLTAKLRAKSDGTFRVRCMSKSGTEHIRIISSLEFEITGFGKAFTNPYEFVSAGLYDYSKGEIGNGNEHGVATARDGESYVGFENLDFGAYGSDEITVPVFALTDEPYEVKIYEGRPDEGGELIGEYIYQKPKMWNIYQLAVWKLKKRLSGITGICFVLNKKVHIKGFSFKEFNRAWQDLTAGECDRIYGDSFVRDGSNICGIGNNVTIEYQDLDFGEEGTDEMILCGDTPLDKNTIIIRFTEGTEEIKQMIEFKGGIQEQTFVLEPVFHKKNVSFVFLPGCKFDFYSVKFQKRRL